MYQGFFGFAIIIAFQIIFSVGQHLQSCIKPKILSDIAFVTQFWLFQNHFDMNVVMKIGRLALLWASQVAQLVKNLPAMLETRFNSWVRKFPWRRDRLPTPVFLDFPGDSTGKESSCNVRDWGLTPVLGKSLGGGHGNWLPVFLPGESPWTEESDGIQSMGSQSARHDWRNKQITAAQHFFPGGYGRVSSWGWHLFNSRRQPQGVLLISQVNFHPSIIYEGSELSTSSAALVLPAGSVFSAAIHCGSISLPFSFISLPRNEFEPFEYLLLWNSCLISCSFNNKNWAVFFEKKVTWILYSVCVF